MTRQRAVGALGGEPQSAQDALHLRGRDRDAAEALEAGERQSPARRPVRRPGRALVERAAQHLAARDLGDEARRPRRGARAGVGIGAALEAVRGVGLEAQPARHLAHRAALEVGALEEEVAGRRGDLAVAPAHHPCQGHGALRVGDHQHALFEPPLDAVERHQPLARPRRAHHDARPREPRQVEGVEGLTHLPQDVVGGVDHVVDRPLADRLETAAQPRRALADAHAAHHARRVAQAARVGDLDPRRFAGARAGLRRRPLGLAQRPLQLDRQLARQPEMVHGVGPVGGDVDVEHRVVVARFEALDGEPDRGQRRGELRRRRHVDEVRQPGAQELHGRTCLSSRSSFSNSSRMLGMP